MFCLKLRRRFSIAMLLTSLVVFPWTDCRAWELKIDSQNVTVENGVESNIDFYLTDYRSLNVSLRIIVQHRSTDGPFIKKCQIEHSASGVCQAALSPCECVGESSGSYRYRLRMTFTEQDGGQWMFKIFNHGETLVNITVIQSITSSQDHQSTEPAQVTGVTPIIESYTLSTTTLVILIIIVLVVFIIISLFAVFRCHSNTHCPVLGKAVSSGSVGKLVTRTLTTVNRFVSCFQTPKAEQTIPMTESRSEEQYDDLGRMEQGQCEVQSSMTATSCHVQSAHHLELTTEASGIHYTKEHFSCSVKQEETTDFRKSVETDADSVTSTTTTPSTPELPPRLYK